MIKQDFVHAADYAALAEAANTDPQVRRLLGVQIDDAIEAHRVFKMLMGMKWRRAGTH